MRVGYTRIIEEKGVQLLRRQVVKTAKGTRAGVGPPGRNVVPPLFRVRNSQLLIKLFGTSLVHHACMLLHQKKKRREREPM